MVWAAISVGPIITFNGRITVREYVDRLDNYDPVVISEHVFQDDNAPIHTAGTGQSWLD
jgi:hypothetical protein